MSFSLPKPKIAVQLDRVVEYLTRMICDHQYRAVFVYGPKGIGKTVLVKQVFQANQTLLIPIQDATLFGIRAAFMANPTGYFWMDDYGDWQKDVRYCNFLKQALDSTGDRQIGALNRDTLRQDAHGRTQKTHFDGRLVVTSNTDIFELPRSVRDHVEAVTDRGVLLTISSDPRDLLAYLDWQVVENDYYRTALFRATSGVKIPLAVSEIQDVLNFLHTYSGQLPLTFRTLNLLAVERKLHPQNWDTNLMSQLLPGRSYGLGPAPQMLRRHERLGLPEPDAVRLFRERRAAQAPVQEAAALWTNERGEFVVPPNRRRPSGQIAQPQEMMTALRHPFLTMLGQPVASRPFSQSGDVSARPAAINLLACGDVARAQRR